MKSIEMLVIEYQMIKRAILQAVEVVPEERMAEQPGGLPNHPTWTLGHLMCVADFTMQVLGHEAKLSDEFKALFDYGSQPKSDPSLYPDKATMVRDYERFHSEFTAAVENAPEGTFDREMPIAEIRDYFPTIGRLVLHVMSTHEATHYGQLTCWCKAANIERPSFA